MTRKRRAISAKTRFEIFKRDSFTCQYCGEHPPTAILHVDHIIAVASGGGNEDENLVTSCSSCNLGKGARALGDVPQSLSSKAEEVREREAQLAGYNAIMAARRARIEEDAWLVLDPFLGAFGLESIPTAWLQSVKKFIEQLGLPECIDAMEIALAKGLRGDYQTFRYFCGVCWRWIREGRE